VTFVLDASIAACWCFHDEQDDRADLAFERLFIERALVPLLWWFEVRNVALIGERRKRVTDNETTVFLNRLEKFSIDLASLPDRTAVIALARRHNLTFYDAAYLELAKREKIPLATLDRALTAAAQKEGVALLTAGS
jgi:predicted nucleic acid-binding protein